MPKQKAAKKDHYQYSDLSSIKKEGEEDQYHFYGVVIDASFPYKGEKRYVVTCKVADPSSVAKGGKLNTVNVVFFSQNFEDLPIIQRVGDIVRVHRARLQHYNDAKQLNVNMYYRSSWCLFIGNDKEAPLEPKVENEDGTNNYFSYTPYNFSGKSFTQEGHETKILKDLKKWSKDYFSNNDVVEQVKKADIETAMKNKTDFDLLAKVTEISDNDQYTNTVSLNDSTGQTWTGHLFKRKFPHLVKGDVLRIKSVSAKEDNSLIFSSHSNILKFFSFSSIHKKLKSSISSDTHIKTCVTKIDKAAHNKMDITPLKKLFFNPKKSEKLFRSQFSVLKVDTKNLEDYVGAFDGKKWHSYKGKKTPKDAELRWNIKLIVTDYKNQQDDKAYMIHLDDNSFFKGINPANWSNAATKKKAEKAFSVLTNNKVNYVDAILERDKKNYHIRHTQFK
uniref:Telomere-binding protein 51 kDa subunit n=1 Tax=Euplotes crassus TaxID=5936 RepID=TEB_EUPCR|nr:RecName: Full=Telomere-binding protein 51 kDa subunit [Moneuplotes crassus]AAA29127.1 51 kDa telomere-binding protein [Moneuplotes crassus]